MESPAPPPRWIICPPGWAKKFIAARHILLPYTYIAAIYVYMCVWYTYMYVCDAYKCICVESSRDVEVAASRAGWITRTSRRSSTSAARPAATRTSTAWGAPPGPGSWRAAATSSLPGPLHFFSDSFAKFDNPGCSVHSCWDGLSPVGQIRTAVPARKEAVVCLRWNCMDTQPLTRKEDFGSFVRRIPSQCLPQRKGRQMVTL